MDIKKDIRKYTLQNAVKFGGKANVGAVVGKVIAEHPDMKDKIKELMKDIQKIVKDVNSIKPDKQLEELQESAPELLEKKEKKKKELQELPNAVTGKVVTRIPPEPSKYLHIGHGLSFILNYMYALKYDGKCVLRFEDTNPEKSAQEYADAILDDVKGYLGIKLSSVVYVSDDMEKFYDAAERLVKKGNAYVCRCERDAMKDKRFKGIECECRTLPNDENIRAWKEMLKGKFDEGECSLRMKIDMKAGNAVMRDPVIMRIVKAAHYRQKKKYNVWPMYDFANALEDEFCNVTHILRSNEFGNMRVELQDHIKNLLGFKKQTSVQYGRFAITDTITQGRDIRKLIEEKKVDGWDDISLVTLRALKRRGFVKEALYELALEVGLTPTPTNIDWSVLNAINRKIIDPNAYRYFFVENPKKIKIEDAPLQNVELDLHPENKKGGREFKTHEDFYVAEKDYKEFKDGRMNRLMDCLNFIKKKDKFVFDSLEHDKFKDKGDKIMHWLPADDGLMDVEVLMPDHSVRRGLGEKRLNDVKEGEVIQLARFGFYRLDKKEKNKLKFWFTHE